MHDLSDSERLLEESWTERGRRLPRRELALETLLSCVLVGVSVALIAVAPGGHEIDVWTVVAVGLYAAATRIAFPLGGLVHAVPTQPLLITLFALAPPPAVPLLVLVGLAIGSAGACARKGQHVERLAFVGGDAAHALGPALVLVAAGVTDVRDVSWAVLAGAFAAQLLLDLIFSTLREWVALGVRPKMQLLVMLQVWAVDAALAPIGIFAALAVGDAPYAPLAVAPLLAILAFATKDRRERIERAHARLAALERERSRLRVAVRRVGEAFGANLDLDAVLRITTSAAVEALDADSGRAVAARGTGRDLVRRAVAGSSADADDLLDAVEGLARTASGPVEARAGDVVALACPIAGSAGAIAVVSVARRGAEFAVEESALLGYLCQQAAVSAANAIRHETLHRQALTDDLTGLANHRRFQELLGAAVERHIAYGERVALLLLDLDDFKQINDLHGHQTGDAVLRAVGRCLYQECRVADEPARYGGEELAVLLAEVDEDQAVQLGERLREEIAALALTTADGDPLQVTVSVGVASLGGHVQTKESLLRAADAALYHAKAQCKNRVCGAAA
jgi:diguanylate cyclase (GGDEF)-like protein